MGRAGQGRAEPGRAGLSRAGQGPRQSRAGRTQDRTRRARRTNNSERGMDKNRTAKKQGERQDRPGMLAFVGSPRRSPRAGSDLARGDLAGLRPKNEARHETPSEATHEADNEPPDIDSGSSPTTGTVDHTAHRRSRHLLSFHASSTTHTFDHTAHRPGRTPAPPSRSPHAQGRGPGAPEGSPATPQTPTGATPAPRRGVG